MSTDKGYTYLVEQTYDKSTGNKFSILEDIPQEIVDELLSCFKVTGIFHSITQIKDIVVQNGSNFQNYVSERNLSNLRQQNVDRKTIILNANRLVLNYATSLKTFIDMETRILSRHKKTDELEFFKKLCSHYYDSSKEYRFWMNFRNYIIHCDFPYHGFNESLQDGYNLICSKKHLLEFDNWKHSKRDILEMDDDIDLSGMVTEMSALIMALYIDFFAYFGKEITDSILYFSNFCKENNVKHPLFLKTSRKLTKENYCETVRNSQLNPLPIEALYQVFEQLRSNPNVDITITSI